MMREKSVADLRQGKNFRKKNSRSSTNRLKVAEIFLKEKMKKRINERKIGLKEGKNLKENFLKKNFEVKLSLDGKF